MLIAIVGKAYARIYDDDLHRIRHCPKKGHIIFDGRSLCGIEDMFTLNEPMYTWIECVSEEKVCKNCLSMTWRYPRLSVLLGESID